MVDEVPMAVEFAWTGNAKAIKKPKERWNGRIYGKGRRKSQKWKDRV